MNLIMKIDPEKLKLVRTKAGLTQVELSKITGINRSTYKNWEQGNSTPRPDDMLKVALAIGKNIKYLEDEGVIISGGNEVPDIYNKMIPEEIRRILKLYNMISDEKKKAEAKQEINELYGKLTDKID